MAANGSTFTRILCLMSRKLKKIENICRTQGHSKPLVLLYFLHNRNGFKISRFANTKACNPPDFAKKFEKRAVNVGMSLICYNHRINVISPRFHTREVSPPTPVCWTLAGPIQSFLLVHCIMLSHQIRARRLVCPCPSAQSYIPHD